MGVELKHNQLEAIGKLSNGKILCGGVGSGKSRTALGYYYIQECHGLLQINGVGVTKPMTDPKDLYIITTAKKRDTLDWEKECIPFLLSTDRKASMNGIKVTVDSWNNIKKYLNVMNAFFIFDEQKVVGKGAWVKAFLRITKLNHWILLSATPGDTWLDYIPVFIANGFYKNRTEFCRQHVIFSRFAKYPKVIGYVNEGRLIRLKSDILVNIKETGDERRKTIRHYHDIIVNWDKELYLKIHRDRWNVYEDTPIEQISEVCYLERKAANSDQDRIDRLKELLGVHHKAIIFYSFDYELDILRKVAKDIGRPCAEMNGHKHEPIPSKPEWIYLVNYSSGAEGWNCVQTDTIIFYSQTYSYKVYEQSCGRIDRINTPYTDLYYYNLRSMAPIDCAIKKALKNKQTFNEKNYIS